MSFDATRNQFLEPEITADILSSTSVGTAQEIMTDMFNVDLSTTMRDLTPQGPKNSGVSLNHEYEIFKDGVSQAVFRGKKGLVSTHYDGGDYPQAPGNGEIFAPQVKATVQLNENTPSEDDYWATKDFNSGLSINFRKNLAPANGTWTFVYRISGKFGANCLITLDAYMRPSVGSNQQATWSHSLSGGGLYEASVDFVISNVV